MTQTSLIRPVNELIAEPQRNYPSLQDLPQLPTKIRELLECLQKINRNSNEKGFIQSQRKENERVDIIESENFAFCSAFKRLSQLEQKQFLSLVMEELQNKKGKSKVVNDYTRNQQDYPCTMRVISCCIPLWNNITLRLNKQRKTLKLIVQGKATTIYLREYLLRKSKVHPLCFVLQNVGFAVKNMEYTYHIRFLQKDGEMYSFLERQIINLIANVHSEALLKIVNQEQKVKTAISKCRGQLKLFLNKRNMTKLEELEQTIQSKQRESVTANHYQQSNRQTNAKPKVQGNYLNSQQVANSSEFKVQMIKNEENLHRATFSIKQESTTFLNNFIDAYKSSHSMIVHLRILESLPQSIQTGKSKLFTAFYHKILHNQKIYGQTLIGLQSGFDKQVNTFSFTLLNIDHDDNLNLLHYLQISVKKQVNNSLEINLIAKFTKEAASEHEVIEAYLSKFIDIFEKKISSGVHTGNLQIDKHFLEVKNNKEPRQEQILQPLSDQTTNLQLLKRDTNKDIENMFSDNFNDKQKKVEVRRILVSHRYLTYKYHLEPSKEKKGRIMKEHFLWNNWKRAEKGGLVCKDEELVEKQKKMFKLILKKFGETLLSGRNIINFSLPVIVFKKESHLESLAKSYLYSPIFTQKAASNPSPLERMKFSVVLMVTENALSIHMEKPFNPILGETYQGWINGCPMYLEQISHHPPTSAYYFLGRGYKKYGCIEPKISVGLNNASGFSIFPHFVEFDDGMKIEYICAKMVIGGLLIGQRTFNFEDKIYAYDRKHGYFASVKFGPKKKSFFTSNSQPEDYFHGAIYEVKPDFQKYFDTDKETRPHPEDKHIIQTLVTFDGIWNSFVNINGEEVLNLKTDLPYEFEPESVPLPSDSIYRQDLSNLLAGDLEAAQIAKQQMEQLQRSDRKLRESHSE